MKSFNNILIALLMVSSATAAEAPPESSTRNIEGAIAQAQAQAEKASAAAARADSKRESRRAPTDEEELALAAMEGLMSQPPERALPIIKRVLAGSQTTLVKRRALFVLSQIDAPEAQEILLQTSRSADEGLRQEAIRSIGISGNPKSLAALQEIYKSGDETVKREVLQAWLIAGRKEDVYQAALNAKSDAEANEAIRMLGAMGAADELRKLGDRPNAGRGLVDAYAISGDLASLRKIADGSGDVSIRSEAVQKIGIIGNDAARSALREIYTGSPDAKIKDAALQGMLISGDDDGVLTLYRAAKTADEKRALLRTLSMMDSDAALQAIDAALEGKK
jgi:HEAT repeat protein